MRGRFCTQPFLVEGGACRPITFLLLPRWVSRSPPHPPQCAHWGTFPPRGRLWRVETQRGGNVLSQKCFFSIFFRKNASQIGFSIPEETSPLPYQRQRSPKRASGSKRAMKTRGPGACPWCSFPRLSSKKVGLPRRSRRGTHVAGSTLQWFQRNRLPMTEDPRRAGGAYHG